jgi:PhnB protein
MPARSTKKSKPAKASKSGKAAPAAKRPTKTAAKRPAARNAVKSARKGAAAPPARLQYRNVTPMLVVKGASDAIAWYGKVFGAKELSRNLTPDGKVMHAAIQLGDSTLMLADAFMGPVPDRMVGVTLHIQRADIDALWAKATANGATVEMPLANQFWGDRYGQLRDPFGHSWSLGWPAKMTQPEKDRLQREAQQMFAAAPPS